MRSVLLAADEEMNFSGSQWRGGETLQRDFEFRSSTAPTLHTDYVESRFSESIAAQTENYAHT